MNIRPVLAALAGAGALLVTSGTPAFADGPPVPAGCSFDQATGVLTCVTTTNSTGTLGPFTTNGANGPTPASAIFDRFTGTQICITIYGTLEGPQTETVIFKNLVLSATITTTTTTERHGLNSKVFHTSTSTSPVSLIGFVPADLDACIFS